MSRDDRLQRAIEYIRTGRKAAGGQILAQLVREEPGDENAWLWLSTAVTRTDQKRYCLERVLQVNPGNRSARIMLQKLGTVAKDNQLHASRSETTKPLWSAKSFSWRGFAIAAIVLALIGSISIAGAAILTVFGKGDANEGLELITFLSKDSTPEPILTSTPSLEFSSPQDSQLFEESKTLDYPYPEEGSIQLVQYSPDGQLFAYGTDWGVVRVWDAQVENMLWSTDFGDGDVYSIAWSPDSQVIACGIGSDLVLLDAQSGAYLGVLEIMATVNSLSWSPDGRLLAAASGDRGIFVWNVETDTLLQTLEGHGRLDTTSVAWRSDGKVLASGDKDGTVRLWDAQTGNLLQVLTNHTGPVWSVAWNPDGSVLASGSADQSVRLWDGQSGVLIGALKGHEGTVLGMAWEPSGLWLASTSTDGGVRLWDTGTLTLLQTLRGHYKPSWASGLTWSPDGDTIASAAGDVRIWVRSSPRASTAPTPASLDAVSMHLPLLTHPRVSITPDNTPNVVNLLDIEGSMSPVVFEPSPLSQGYSISWHSTNPRILATGHLGGANIWDVETGKILQSIEIGEEYEVSSLDWSPDGTILAIGASLWPDDGIIYLWDVQGGNFTQALQGHDHVIHSIAWSPDGQTLASGSYDGKVRLWDDRGGALLSVPDGYRDTVREIAWHPEGQALAVAYAAREDGAYDYDTVRLWDVDSGTVVETLGMDDTQALSVAWSPGGQALAIGGTIYSDEFNGEDDVITLWDAQDSTLLGRLTTGEYSEYPQFRSMRSIAWSPDQRLILGGGGGLDSYVHLWDAETGTVLGTWEAGFELFGVDWSPDGSAFAAVCRNGLAGVWMIW